MTYRDCFASYMGCWAILPRIAAEGHQRYLAGTVPPASPDDANEPYSVHGGIAVLSIEDVMMRGKSKLGGTSTIHVQRELVRAVSDPAVGGTMIHAHTPGGTVDGSHGLYERIVWANSIKPVHVHGDLICSAGYHVASGASRITAGASAMIGSLGVILTVVDSSKAAEVAGVKIIAITSDGAEAKATGMDGTPVTDEQVAELRSLVNGHADIMLGDIVAGPRGKLDRKGIKAMNGGVFLAAEAKSLGLIDKVETFDEAMANLQSVIARAGTSRRLNKARIDSAGG